MFKKTVMSSLIIIIIPTILFGLVYSIMLFTVNNDATNYRNEIQGVWSGVQYYLNGEKQACNEIDSIYMKFTDNEICISGTVLPEGTYDYTWSGGKTIFMTVNDEEIMFSLSINSQKQLKINIDEWKYIITLQKD